MTHLLQGAAIMAAPWIRNLDLELSDSTHLAVHSPISVR
jgi:hypothetical protein